MSTVFPERVAYNKKVVEVGINYANSHVSRNNDPEQICNYLEVSGEPRDPSISFCAAFGGYIRCHAYCDLMNIPYDSTNVVKVFKGMAHAVSTMDLLVSASCEDIRQYAIKHGIWHTVDSLGDATKFKPGWVMLMNYETSGPEAHHFATVISSISQDSVKTIEGNTSSEDQAHGGAVAVKVRSLSNIHYRGVIVTY